MSDHPQRAESARDLDMCQYQCDVVIQYDNRDHKGLGMAHEKHNPKTTLTSP